MLYTNKCFPVLFSERKVNLFCFPFFSFPFFFLWRLLLSLGSWGPRTEFLCWKGSHPASELTFFYVKKRIKMNFKEVFFNPRLARTRWERHEVPLRVFPPDLPLFFFVLLEGKKKKERKKVEISTNFYP